jgi:hypothetical protein
MKLISFFSLILAAGLSLNGNDIFDQQHALQYEKISKALQTAIKASPVAEIQMPAVSKNLIPIFYAGKQHRESMDALFQASERLAINKDLSTLQQHPLYKHFHVLNKNDVFKTTLKSGPDIQDFTMILSGNHALDIARAHLSETISMKLFNNAETFFRCFDIFKTAYQKHTGKTIHCDLSYSLTHTPLQQFCEKYIHLNPEIKTGNTDLFNKIVNLISVFEIDNDIVNLEITPSIRILDEQVSERLPSFKPISLHLSSNENNVSNDISLGQQDLNKQIQNLSGSELAMPYIKDADGYEQFKILSSFQAKKNINLVEIGGGRGETNAVPNALQEIGLKINLLNAEPYEPFANTYINAHKAIGIDNVQVIQKTAQQLSVEDITNHFKEKAHAVFASHSFYFILNDLHTATQAYVNDKLKPLEDHPLTKYFDMLQENGVLVVTLQSGAGARLMRNALLNNHGLDLNHAEQGTVASILRSFGNLETFLRHLELFAKLYEQKFNRKISIKMHHSVANVPLGGLKIELDQKTGGYILHNPHGEDADSSWLGQKMMDFYGNWKELQTLATLTLEDALKMASEDLKKIGLEQLTAESLAAKRSSAIKTQETFLHILRAFAPGLVNMQHPNITLEIRVEPKK